jgi:zinc protease
MKWPVSIVIGMVSLAALATSAHADDPKIEFQKYTLPNGLEVILAPDSTVPIVAVNVWYHVGSGDEVPGKSGFAHLFEHMMFQGSKNTGADAHFKILRQIGSTNVNGTTNSERTNYFEVVPSHQLETALWLESDRMGHLLDVLSSKEMANQIDVVRNEKRQNYDNRPYTNARFAMLAALYPENHPYRYMTIGKHEDLERANVEDVKKFFRTWYVPANATLTISGDFDLEATKKLVDKWFGTFPKSEKPKVVMIPPPSPAAKEVTVDDSFAKLRQITFGWISPRTYTDEDADLDFVADALSREGVGSLYKSLVYDKQLAQSVRANQGGETFNGTFEITVTLRRNADIEQVKKIVADEVARMTREPLTAKDLARVVAGFEARAVYELEDVNGRANLLQECNQYFGDPGCISRDLDRYRNATPDKIRATAAKYLVPAHMMTVITNPTKEGAK